MIGIEGKSIHFLPGKKSPPRARKWTLAGHVEIPSNLLLFENLSISLNNSKAEFDPLRISPPEESISARHCP
jgi:hypothetical protein